MKTVNLTKNKKAFIDDDDYDRVTNNKWSFHHTGYAVRGKPQISFHRFIIGARNGQCVDHINRNKLDNRKENLRFCKPGQNIHNSMREDGIHWRPDRKAWIVRMKIKGVSTYIGYFKEKPKAIEARRDASLKNYKSFSPYA